MIEHGAAANVPRRHRLIEGFGEGNRDFIAVWPAECDAPNPNAFGLIERFVETEAFHHIHAFSADGIAADFIAGEGIFIEQEHAQAGAGHEGGRRGPTWASTDNKGIVLGQ